MTNKTLKATLLVITGIGLGLLAAFFTPQIKPPQTIEWLGQARDIPDFSLDSAGGPFNQQHLQKGWSLLLFGYMQCPDVCPTSLAALSKLQQQLKKTPVNIVFISVDSQRDKPQALAQYSQYFNPAFNSATGTQQQLKLICDALGYQFNAQKTSKNYTVAHSLSIAIINPQGQFVGRIRPGFDLTATAAQLRNKITVLGA